jgi:F-type H+-transporting ATPase subunit a
MNLHISLAPEVIGHVASFSVTNSMLGSLLVTLVLCMFGIIVGSTLQEIPGRLQNTLEMLYEFLLNLTEKIIGRSEVARDLFPYAITLFLFILTSYWFGLLPGVSMLGIKEVAGLTPLFRSPINDINTVAAMAYVTMVYVQVMHIRYHGLKGYLSSFFNFRSGTGFFTGILELVTEFNRLISFTFRLFGNVFAGEVLIAVIIYLTAALVPYVFVLPAPFLLLEFFLGIIQAFVFAFLTIVLTSLVVTRVKAPLLSTSTSPVMNPI